MYYNGKIFTFANGAVLHLGADQNGAVWHLRRRVVMQKASGVKKPCGYRA